MFWQQQRTTRKLKELSEGVETLERSMKRIQLEWEDTYDKLRVLMQRIVKRAERIEQEHRSVAVEERAEGEVPETPSGSSLSPRLQEINDRILARRNRMRAAQ